MILDNAAAVVEHDNKRLSLCECRNDFNIKKQSMSHSRAFFMAGEPSMHVMNDTHTHTHLPCIC